jgi:membrane protein YqaA with SNARE-associated domain
LVPAQSELLLAALLATDCYDPWLLLAAATAGNVLGSVLNWALGRFLHDYRHRPWFPIPARALDKAERTFNRWGVWSLLLSWVPLIGDPLTLAAGLLRTPLKLFVPLVLVAKFGRYLVVSGLVHLF